jgi:hypothetical protein
MRTMRRTGRVARWRGQILHVCGILAVNLRDRGMDAENADAAWRSGLQDQLKEVFAEFESQCPSVKEVSTIRLTPLCPRLISDRIFRASANGQGRLSTSPIGRMRLNGWSRTPGSCDDSMHLQYPAMPARHPITICMTSCLPRPQATSSSEDSLSS